MDEDANVTPMAFSVQASYLVKKMFNLNWLQCFALVLKRTYSGPTQDTHSFRKEGLNLKGSKMRRQPLTPPPHLLLVEGQVVCL